VASHDVLSQAEVDALLHGVDSGSVDTKPAPAPGEARPYDFTTEARIVRGRLPALEQVNERFVRQLRTSLASLLRRGPEVSINPVKVQRFQEYVHTLHAPTSLDLVKFQPLRGTALVVVDPKLVFAVVDAFFGGSGRSARIDGRDFTPTETRIVHRLVRQVLDDLRQAWSPVLAIVPEWVGRESNPSLLAVATPADIFVLTCFHIELEGGGGDLHVAMPYAMLEPLRDRLDGGVTGDDAPQDERWSQTLRDEVEDAEVPLTSVLGRASISLGQLLDLKAGDVLPCDFDGRVTLFADGIPLFRGSCGRSRGQHAVKVDERVGRGKRRNKEAAG
jgi:flagellar motor switch protein FliM